MALFDLSFAVKYVAKVDIVITRIISDKVLDPDTGRFSTSTTTTLPIKAKFQPLAKASVELVPEGYILTDSEEMHTITELLLTRRTGPTTSRLGDRFDRKGKTFEIVGEYGSFKENGNFHKYITGSV